MAGRRRKSGPNIVFTILGFVVVGILGLIYTLTGRAPTGSFSGTDTPVIDTPTVVVSAVPPTSTVASDWWEVYFTDPVNMGNPEQWQGSVEAQLINKINNAQRTIHIASFEFDLTQVAEALIAAKQRGVEILWVTDDEHGLEADEEPGHGQFAMLRAAGIEVRSDTRSALMHNKFWIFDWQTVWTGSTNITENGIFDQNNNVLVIHSPEVAAIYETEFQEMWNGQFGPRSPSQILDQSANINGSQILVIFTSEDKALETAIIPFVLGAQSSVYFMAFSFTDYPLAAAMIQRRNSGVEVAGVFEAFGSTTDAAELRTLFCGSVPVRQDGNGGFLHHKLIVVDERYVITGSLNFSTNAETSNDENVIIIDNTEIAQLYIQEFERVWALGKDVDPAKMVCQ
ncbi:MAG TPA: phospholipase D-like domain-containing protein [Anaerolineales bacterium]|nr:phospholipase D-like domain-containing protein [Anaerolineales bacterium]